MKIPDIPCSIRTYCEVNPSEDSEKVKHAISNVILDAKYIMQETLIKATSKTWSLFPKFIKLCEIKELLMYLDAK